LAHRAGGGHGVRGVEARGGGVAGVRRGVVDVHRVGQPVGVHLEPAGAAGVVRPRRWQRRGGAPAPRRRAPAAAAGASVRGRRAGRRRVAVVAELRGGRGRAGVGPAPRGGVREAGEGGAGHVQQRIPRAGAGDGPRGGAQEGAVRQRGAGERAVHGAGDPRPPPPAAPPQRRRARGPHHLALLPRALPRLRVHGARPRGAHILPRRHLHRAPGTSTYICIYTKYESDQSLTACGECDACRSSATCGS
jgi:hypothetical protein